MVQKTLKIPKDALHVTDQILTCAAFSFTIGVSAAGEHCNDDDYLYILLNLIPVGVVHELSAGCLVSGV